MGNTSKTDDNTSRAGGAVRETLRPTIVGGRPPRRGRGRTRIPRGIEVLVKKASVDPQFREVLLDERAKAAREIALELSPVETATLNSVPRAQIEKIIESTTVPDEHRRIFLGKMGAAMVAVLGLGLSACKREDIPSIYDTAEDKTLAYRTAGISPDETASRQMKVRAVPVEAGREKLRVSVVGEGKNSVTVLVMYDCPFENGEVRIYFGLFDRWRRIAIKYEPHEWPVSRGRGEVTFNGSVSGKGGTSNRLLVRLRNTSPECREAVPWFPMWPVSPVPPGEYIVEDCVLWRIAEFKKEWPS